MKRHYAILVSILALALAPRLMGLFYIAPNDFYASPWYRGEGGDAAEYSTIAVNLAQGHGFSLEGRATNIRPPLYPFFLAAVYKVFGNENLTAVRGMQIILALATLMLFWLFTRRLTASVDTAHVATLVLGLYPRFVAYNLVLLTETIFFGLILATLFGALLWYETKKSIWLTGAMGMLALAALTRPTALYVAPFLLLWAGYVHGKTSSPRQSLSEARVNSAQKKYHFLLPGLLLFAALTGMWIVRNYIQFNSFTFSNKSGGGLAEAWDRTILEPLGISTRDILTPYKHLSEEEFAKAGYKLFFTEIRDHPTLITKILFLKATYWFNPFVKSSSGLFRALHATFTSVLFILGAYGLWRYSQERGKETPLLFLLLMGVFSAMHILTVPYHRYRFPVIDPYLILFASYAIVVFWHRLKRVWIPKISSGNA